MSMRPTIRPHSVITDGAMTADITSEVTVLNGITCVGYSYSWAGTAPVGSIAVEVSNDYELNSTGTVAVAGTWTPLTFTYSGTTVSALPVAGATGTGFADIQKTGAYAIRTVYTFTSGTGTLQAKIVGKVA